MGMEKVGKGRELGYVGGENRNFVQNHRNLRKEKTAVGEVGKMGMEKVGKGREWGCVGRENRNFAQNHRNLRKEKSAEGGGGGGWEKRYGEIGKVEG